MPVERLPSLAHLPQPESCSPTAYASSRNSSTFSNGSPAESQSPYTSAHSSVHSSVGPQTPSPTFPVNAVTGPATSIAAYDAMNSGQHDMYYQHMSAAQQQNPQTVTSGAMSQYGHQQPPPLLQPGPGQYQPSPYSGYGYANGLTSPPAAQPVGSSGLPLPGISAQNAVQNSYGGYDTTGQVSPQGMKPRVTATLWEDEGSLCFQVEARGICVARREDNHMINGTKLLNVAGMTRGRRDGILKSEKIRHVVKIGPMHLKGVWIPYDRALEFANKEKITEILYPLFVHNISALLYHPSNANRTTQVMELAAQRNKPDGGQVRPPGRHDGPPGLPPMPQASPQHSHQPPPQHMGGSQPSMPLHSNGSRPSMDRTNTFPTPPASASSVMPNLANPDHFGWQNQGMNGSQATTPPGSSVHNMQHQSAGGYSYDASRSMYNPSSTQQSPYQTSGGTSSDRMYGPYSKTEMGPPSSRPSVSGPSGELADSKPPTGVGLLSEGSSQPHNGEEEGEQEHGQEYTHDSNAYDAQRGSYNYTAPSVGAMAPEQHVSSENNGSPNPHPGSGRATPRTSAPAQSYYQPQPTGYGTPPRVQQTSSSLYNVMSNDRAPANGSSSSSSSVYPPSAEMTHHIANGYAGQPAPLLNGGNGVKRGRDDDDELPRLSNGVMGPIDVKRRKTLEGSVPAPSYDALARPAASGVAAPPRQ